METELIPTFNIEAARRVRRVEPFVTDYLPDDKTLPYQKRVEYYRLFKDKLGISNVRTEFRMKQVINHDGSFNEDTLHSYEDSLKAMKEAGFANPSLVLFTPDKWMYTLAKSDPDKFVGLYKSYAERMMKICLDSGIRPERVQVLNEVNFNFQTKIDFPMVVRLIKETAGIVKPQFPETKIITTVAAGRWNKDWQGFTKKLMSEAGIDLDGIGFDYYPGSLYEHPAGVPLVGKKPFEAFGMTTPYQWIAEQKVGGILKDKEVILAETGAMGLRRDSKHQRFGYDRILQSLDHFFLDLERKGKRAHDVISAVGFFAGGDIPTTDTKEPRAVGMTRWALMRQDKSGEWQLTSAGEKLHELIEAILIGEQHPVPPLLTLSD
jgi:hypothetical protein